MDSLRLLIAEPYCLKPNNSSTKSPTALYLEQITAELVEHVSKHEWSHPDFQKLISPDYAAFLEYSDYPQTKGLQAYLDHYREFTEANPDYRIEPINISADVNEKNGTAAVWMLLRVGGHPKDVWRESVSIMYWRRKGGFWMGYKQTGIRGVGWYL